MRKYDFERRAALVTGAGSGIGRAVAVALAARGCHLALADIDGFSLGETGHLLARYGTRVSHHVLDVADRAAVAALPDAVAATHGGLDLLVNNAGIALGGRFDEVAAADFERLIEVNFLAVVRLTRAFLPMLRRSADARIVNVSSVFGLIAPPGQVAYVASKFAVRGFSESLRHELAGTSVGVTTIFPGGVATAIARNATVPPDSDPAEVSRGKAAFEKGLVLPPAEAGERIVRAVAARKPRVIIGRDAQAAAILERLLPVAYWPLIDRLRRRNVSQQ